ncbi:hypothetical protein LINPERHAP1_LOCUS3671 [Linum perenne]
MEINYSSIPLSTIHLFHFPPLTAAFQLTPWWSHYISGSFTTASPPLIATTSEGSSSTLIQTTTRMIPEGGSRSTNAFNIINHHPRSP